MPNHKYVAISAGGNNAICINYIAITWPDGDSAFISGDTGRACNRDWYYSRTVVGDATNNYIPSCMWIDGDHSGGHHYQGFHFHIPDFLKLKRDRRNTRLGPISCAEPHRRMQDLEVGESWA